MSNKEINQELSQTRNEISPEIDNEKIRRRLKKINLLMKQMGQNK